MDENEIWRPITATMASRLLFLTKLTKNDWKKKKKKKKKKNTFSLSQMIKKMLTKVSVSCATV